VAELRPDLVVYAGDTFDLREPPEFAVAAISALAHYPSFAILGNHDFLDTAHNIAVFQEHGVPVLRGECEEFFGILICGVDDPVSRFSRRYPEQVADVSLQAESYSGFTFLIAHRPERFADYTAFDLAVTGHAHGGQWRLPGVLTQGLYAPHQGIFPSHTSGQFGNMIVSRGLARHTPIDNSVVTVPRIFNRPELVVIDLLPEIYVG
jgi:predicted MPP superfamily phosphohydrolase